MSISTSALFLLAVPLLAQEKLTLEDLEKMALANNPAVAQSEADIRAAKGRRRQAGAWPNPVIGATGDELAGGPIIRWGEWGGFAEQRIVTAGKLGLRSRIAEQDIAQADAAARAARQRILNAVRSLYYQALGDQRLIEVRTELNKLAAEAVRTSRELSNIGQADRPDLLAAEIEAQQADLALANAVNARDRTWRQLAAVTNRPGLGPSPLEGSLEPPPQLDIEAAIARIEKESPELSSAQAMLARSDLEVRQARKERIPDVVARGGLRHNRELLEPNLTPVGTEGFFDIGVEIPLFNRNQGAIAAARASQDRARLEVDRLRLSLRSRLANVHTAYRNALQAVDRYKNQMVPRAEEAYKIYQASFRQMAASYPQALIAQRNLFQLREGYVMALVEAWRRAVEIQGLLLSVEPDMALTP